MRANNYSINGENATVETVAKRLEYQNLVLIDLDILDCFLEIATKHGYVNSSQLENATLKSKELRDSIIAWKNSDKQRRLLQ